jgi:glutaredoxin
MPRNDCCKRTSNLLFARDVAPQTIDIEACSLAQFARIRRYYVEKNRNSSGFMNGPCVRHAE